jgi:hypothetical protein
MKKLTLLRIVLLIVLFIMIVTTLLNFFYFNSFRNNIRPITEAEKQQVINVLNDSINLEDYQIKFSNVYLSKHKQLAQVELIKGNSKKYYSIDLGSGRIVGR